LAVSGNPTGGELLQATFRDHGSGGVRTTWLNERLLFVQVWWGRIASSDLVIDVERGALLSPRTPTSRRSSAVRVAHAGA